MKESYLFDMKFNNVVFAGRNKAYGAYELRRDYSKHILAAALLATTIFASSLAWPLLVTEKNEQPKAILKKEEKVIILHGDKILPPPPKQEAKAEQPLVAEEKVKTRQYTPPRIVEDNHPGPDQTTPTIQELQGAVIGTQNIDGETASQPNLAGIDNTGGTAQGDGGDGNEGTIFEHVADMPYFAGGEEALMRHISKKIRYPGKAVKEQIEGIVVISFVIDRYGRVTDATVLKGLGYGTDEEALRVINSLPDWTPGRQNGKPVSVRYNLPIRFNLQR